MCETTVVATEQLVRECVIAVVNSQGWEVPAHVISEMTDKMCAVLFTAAETNAKLYKEVKTTLEFYANKDIYKDRSVWYPGEEPPIVLEDEGQRAATMLEELNKWYKNLC